MRQGNSRRNAVVFRFSAFMHAKDYTRDIRKLRNDRSYDPGSEQDAPGFFFVLMPVERPAEILSPLIRIIKVKEEIN